MRDDDSSAIPKLSAKAEIPPPARFQSLLREAQIRAMESGPSSLTGVDETFDWDAPPSELVESLAGFKIIATISEGGQGIVYKARHDETGQLIAVKVLRNGRLSSPSERRRFEREIQTLAKLSHLHIVKLIPLHNKSALKFFCMEFIEGEPIDEYVYQRRLGVQNVVQMVANVCDAVQSAHRALVLHRDLKPGNILVGSDGQPHVLDFGLSRDLDAEMRGLQSRISNAEQRVGTLVYSAPEQVDERFGDVDTRTDVYALGILLYELIVGRKPYPVHGSAREIGESITSTAPKSLRQAAKAIKSEDRWTNGPISDDLERIVLKALEKEKERRYQSVEALKDDLDRYLRGDPVRAKSTSYFYVLRKFIFRHRVGFGLTAALLLTILGATVGLFAMWQKNIHLARLRVGGEYMGSVVQYGRANLSENSRSEAMEQLKMVVAQGKSLHSDDPYVESATFEASYWLAKAYAQNIDLTRFEPYYETAKDIAGRFYQRNPNDVSAIRRQAMVSRLLGDKLIIKDDKVTAVESFRKSVALQKRIVSLAPDDSDQQFQLALYMSILASCHNKLTQPNEALASLNDAFSILNILIAKEPNNIEYLLELAKDQQLAGTACLLIESPEQDRTALDWLLKSKERLERLTKMKAAQYRRNEIGNLLASVNRSIGFFKNGIRVEYPNRVPHSAKESP